MPKVFKSEKEKIDASIARLNKQKIYEKIKRYEKKFTSELNKPSCYHTFRKNFMWEITGKDTYSNNNFLKHIKFCTLIEMVDVDFPIENCICGQNIRYVFICRYYNPKNHKEFVFNVGSSCILNTQDDALKNSMNNFISEHKKKNYTCKYCKTICIHDSGRAFDLFDIETKTCKDCKDKPWCEYCCKNLKEKPYYSKCLECWKLGNNA